MDKIEDEEKRYNRLVELNVIEQTQNVMKMSCMQQLTGDVDKPQVHGWVFDMKTGEITDLKVF